MKNFAYILLTIAFLSSCSSDELTKKKSELAGLKSQETEIKSKIATLEKEIAKLSGTKTTAPHEVAVTNISTATFSHFIEVQARVDGDENIAVSAEVPGTVNKINVKVGDHVTKGSVLAELDNQTYLKSLDELQNAREFANTLYLKQKSLWDQKIGTEVQYLQAKNSLESIDRKIATVREQLAMTKIKAPITGTVDAMEIKVGQMFAPGMPGVRVVNLDELKVKAEVAEAYISKVKKGDDVEVNFPDINQSINAKISYSGKVIDPLNRTFNVEISLNQKSVELHPNMVAIIKIADYVAKNAFVLPASVVQTTPEGSYVFVADGKMAKKQTVTIGKNYKGQVEVTGGIKAGDPVITTGYQDLVDGQPIKL
jgi:RND family efflux transporter MFP subunit